MTVALIGSSTGTSTATITVPAGGVPANSCIVVLSADASPTFTMNPSITDSASNSYHVVSQYNWNNSGSNGFTAISRVNPASALVQNNTITYTASIAGNVCTVAAIYITGLANASADVITNAFGNTSGAVNGTLTPLVSDLIVACLGCNGTQSSLTQSASFTAIPGLVQLAGPALIGGWTTAPANSLLTYTATLGTGSVYSIPMAAFPMSTTDQSVGLFT